MKTFNIDPDYLRVLAREMDSEAAHAHVPALPPLPGGPLSEFATALSAAHSGLSARVALMRGDLSQLADAAVATAHAAVTVDHGGAAAFEGMVGR